MTAATPRPAWAWMSAAASPSRDSVTGLSLDVRVRTLVVHHAEGFTERRLSLSFGRDEVDRLDEAGGAVAALLEAVDSMPNAGRGARQGGASGVPRGTRRWSWSRRRSSPGCSARLGIRRWRWPGAPGGRGCRRAVLHGGRAGEASVIEASRMGRCRAAGVDERKV